MVDALPETHELFARRSRGDWLRAREEGQRAIEALQADGEASRARARPPADDEATKVDGTRSAVDEAAAEGLSLLTSRAASGFRGVYKTGSAALPYRAVMTEKTSHKQTTLGQFRTAEEAALCYARERYNRLHRLSGTPDGSETEAADDASDSESIEAAVEDVDEADASSAEEVDAPESAMEAVAGDERLKSCTRILWGPRALWRRVFTDATIPRPMSTYGISGSLTAASTTSVLLEMQLKPGDVFCDLGCGDGAVLCAVRALAPGVRVVGVDGDEGMVEATKRNLETFKTANYAITCRPLQNLEAIDATVTHVFCFTEALRGGQATCSRLLQLLKRCSRVRAVALVHSAQQATHPIVAFCRAAVEEGRARAINVTQYGGGSRYTAWVVRATPVAASASDDEDDQPQEPAKRARPSSGAFRPACSDRLVIVQFSGDDARIALAAYTKGRNVEPEYQRGLESRCAATNHVCVLVTRWQYDREPSRDPRVVGAFAAGIAAFGSWRDTFASFLLTHIRTHMRERGFASILVEAVKELLPRADLHAQSPACRTRIAVKFWLRHGFFVDPSIFQCELPEVGGAVGGAASQLNFHYSPLTQSELHAEHVARVCAKHGLEI